MNKILMLNSVNGSPNVEYRTIDNYPMPHQITIQRREWSASGNPSPDESDWKTLTIGAVLQQLRMDWGPVARWLREETRVDCSMAYLMSTNQSWNTIDSLLSLPADEEKTS